MGEYSNAPYSLRYCISNSNQSASLPQGCKLPSRVSKEIYQDSVRIIGKIEKLDCLRYGNTGLSSFYFVLSIPNPKAKRNIFLPCTIYGSKAEEFEKLVSNHKIKLGDLLEITGSHRNAQQGMNKSKDNHISLEHPLGLEIKVSQFEEISKENSLFEGEVI